MTKKRKGREHTPLFGDAARNVAPADSKESRAGSDEWQEGDTLRPNQLRAVRGDEARDEMPDSGAVVPATDEAASDPMTSGETPEPAKSLAGDTIRMTSIQPKLRADDGTRRPARPKPKPRPAERMPQLPRREYAARHRFGFIWYIFGFFGLIFRTILVTMIVMAVSGWLGYNAMRFYIKTPETTVPNVKGMKVDGALEVLAGAKLGMLQERAEASGLVSPGEIISQTPLPGSRMKEKAVVRVIVSSGRASYVIPSLVDESLENATNKIKSSRLEVGNITEYPSEKPKGTVISQSPEANKGFETPQKVDMLVSTGP